MSDVPPNSGPQPSPAPATRPSADIITPDRAKDPIVILIVALFVGGIAYFVLGQWQKGIAAVALWICAVILSVITCGVGAILLIPIVILLVIDAYSQAKTLKEGRPIGQWTFFSRSAA